MQILTWDKKYRTMNQIIDALHFVPNQSILWNTVYEFNQDSTKTRKASIMTHFITGPKNR